MSERIRAYDWSKHPLGTPDQWPQSLKIAIRIMLTSRYAMWMGWGPEFYFFCNDAYLPTVGIKENWVLGASARKVWAEIWQDIGPRAESVVRTGRATWDESLLLFLERSGYAEETYHTFSYSPLPNDDGSIGGMLCVVTEDTERVIGERRLSALRDLSLHIASIHSEEELFQVLQARLSFHSQDLPFALTYLFGADGKNARLACTHGAIRGESVAVPILPADAPGAVWPAQEILAGGEAVTVNDLGLRFEQIPKGPWEMHPGQARVVPIARQGQERPAGFLVAGLNPYREFDASYSGFLELLAGQISAGLSNARAYEAERERAEALAELDRAKTAFFSNVSHEFRTPLTLILGPLEDIMSSGDDSSAEDFRNLSKVAHRNALRLLRLVNTLLDFSRLEAGRVQAVFEPLDLASLTEEIATSFRSAMEKADLQLIVDCPPLSRPVFADYDMWEKIVLNLISNAFKYTFSGEIRITVKEDSKDVHLTVADTGVGIPKSAVPHLFERFYRVEGASGRTHEGTGIGLSVVNELVRLHGGSIDVVSKHGKGTAFTIRIPQGTAHLPKEKVRPITGSEARRVRGAAPFIQEALRWIEKDSPAKMVGLAAESGNTEVSGERNRPVVLLADDNNDMRSYVGRLLGEYFHVVPVSNGQAALESALQEKPDLILTDIMMPVLDGFGLLRAIRENQDLKQVPVILLSARAGEEAHIEGLEAGADDYLIKPFSTRELLTRVNSHIKLSRTRKEIAERERALRTEAEDLYKQAKSEIAERIRIEAELQESSGALRESEARFRNMADNVPVLIWVNGLNGCEFVNREYLRFLNTSFSNVREMNWTKYIHPEDAERYLQDYVDAFERRLPFESQVRLRRGDGEYRWMRSSGMPRFTSDGKILGYVGCSVDITDIKYSEETLKEADRRKDEFLATLAHELRNPLAPLLNAVRIMTRAAEDADALQQAQGVIERQLQQMVRLTDDLLDVSRISSGKLELRLERVDLGSVIRNAVETSRPLIDSFGHQLHMDIPAIPVYVTADPLRLSQVFANLLNNAAKYTLSEGKIEVVVNDSEVRVRDNGIGIPAANLGRVFDMFAQVHRPMPQSNAGLGIGLSIVRKLVELHGGTVTARSDGEGNGSEFVVRLPAAVPLQPEQNSEAQKSSQAARRHRILVVDDNLDAASTTGMMLKMNGHEVSVAHSGKQAIDLAQSFSPNVILMDIGMPGMSGYDAGSHIREQSWGKDIVLIALTGWGQQEDRQLSEASGFNHHLVKPVDPDVLEQLLNQL